MSDVENYVKYSKLGGREIREVDEKLAKYEFVGFHISLEDLKKHVREILLFYVYLFLQNKSNA